MNFTRKRNSRSERKRILIVCEWDLTEPSYFNCFKKYYKNTAWQIVPVPTGYNTISLVNFAVEELSRRKKAWEEVDETWCVFDADPKPSNPKQLANFNEAIRLAHRKWLEVGYSNQAFEYWLILHFSNNHWAELERNRYKKLINDFLKVNSTKQIKYEKEVTQEIFCLLSHHTTKDGITWIKHAIKCAKKIHQDYEEINPKRDKIWNEESSTTIYKLIEKLLSDTNY